jgi:hypothetical protein
LISPRKTIALCSALPFGGVGRLDDFFVEDFEADSSFLAMYHLLWLFIVLGHTVCGALRYCQEIITINNVSNSFTRYTSNPRSHLGRWDRCS